MYIESDLALAQIIASRLMGKYWSVTPGEWWVSVEGVSSQKLVILTNDPLEIAFQPKELSIGLEKLREKVFADLVQARVINEDGSWNFQ